MAKRGPVGEWFSEHWPEVVGWWAPYCLVLIFGVVVRPEQAPDFLALLGILLGVLALRLYFASSVRRLRHEAEIEAQAGAQLRRTAEPEATPVRVPTESTQPGAAAVAVDVPTLIDLTSRRLCRASTGPPPRDEWKELNRWMFRTTKDEWRARFDELLAADPRPSRATLRRLLADELRTLELPYEAYVTKIDLPRLAHLAGATSDRRLWRRLVRYLTERDAAHRLGQRMSGTSKEDLGPHASDERSATWVRSEANHVKLAEPARARIDGVLKRYEEEFAARGFDDGE